MSSGTAAPTTQKASCFCHHCKKDGFSRRELNHWFLCAECAAIPGVYGYVKTSERGLVFGSVDYWDRTKHQLNVATDDAPSPTAVDQPLNIVGDENAAEVAASSRSVPAPPTRGTTKSKAEFELWHDDVFAANDLNADEKLYLVRLARFSDWGTGGNCFPSLEEQAVALDLSVKKVRNLLAKVVAKGWVIPWGMRLAWRQTSDLYQFARPASAAHGPWKADLIYAKRGPTATLTREKSIGCPSPQREGQA